MRIGQSHRDVAIILLGAFSRWINHLDDNDIPKPRTKVILKALSMFLFILPFIELWTPPRQGLTSNLQSISGWRNHKAILLPHSFRPLSWVKVTSGSWLKLRLLQELWVPAQLVNLWIQPNPLFVNLPPRSWERPILSPHLKISTLKVPW